MAIAKRGTNKTAEEIEDLDDEEDLDQEEVAPAKKEKKAKAAPVVEEDDAEDDEEGEDEGKSIIDYIVDIAADEEGPYGAEITKAEAKRMWRLISEAMEECLFNEGEVRVPQFASIFLDAVPAKEGYTLLGLSEEELKKNPKGKKWTTEAKWNVKAKFLKSMKDRINERAEEVGDTAQAFLDEVEAGE